jgi:hypothetical protein
VRALRNNAGHRIEWCAQSRAHEERTGVAYPTTPLSAGIPTGLPSLTTLRPTCCRARDGLQDAGFQPLTSGQGQAVHMTVCSASWYRHRAACSLPYPSPQPTPLDIRSITLRAHCFQGYDRIATLSRITLHGARGIERQALHAISRIAEKAQPSGVRARHSALPGGRSILTELRLQRAQCPLRPFLRACLYDPAHFHTVSPSVSKNPRRIRETNPFLAREHTAAITDRRSSPRFGSHSVTCVPFNVP